MNAFDQAEQSTFECIPSGIHVIDHFQNDCKTSQCFANQGMLAKSAERLCPLSDFKVLSAVDGPCGLC